jgi:hypothetical protein
VVAGATLVGSWALAVWQLSGESSEESCRNKTIGNPVHVCCVSSSVARRMAGTGVGPEMSGHRSSVDLTEPAAHPVQGPPLLIRFHHERRLDPGLGRVAREHGGAAANAIAAMSDERA